MTTASQTSRDIKRIARKAVEHTARKTNVCMDLRLINTLIPDASIAVRAFLTDAIEAIIKAERPVDSKDVTGDDVQAALESREMAQYCERK